MLRPLNQFIPVITSPQSIPFHRPYFVSWKEEERKTNHLLITKLLLPFEFWFMGTHGPFLIQSRILDNQTCFVNNSSIGLLHTVVRSRAYTLKVGALGYFLIYQAWTCEVRDILIQILFLVQCSSALILINTPL